MITFFIKKLYQAAKFLSTCSASILVSGAIIGTVLCAGFEIALPPLIILLPIVTSLIVVFAFSTLLCIAIEERRRQLNIINHSCDSVTTDEAARYSPECNLQLQSDMPELSYKQYEDLQNNDAQQIIIEPSAVDQLNNIIIEPSAVDQLKNWLSSFGLFSSRNQNNAAYPSNPPPYMAPENPPAYHHPKGA